MSTQEQELILKRLERLATVGAKMRVAQNDYFKRRGPITLEVAKKMEREFDNLVREEVKNITSKQQTIF